MDPTAINRLTLDVSGRRARTARCEEAGHFVQEEKSEAGVLLVRDFVAPADS